MKKYTCFTAFLLAVIIYCVPVYAQGRSSAGQPGAARLRYSFWGSENSAKLEVTSGGTYGTEFSLNDLGMDKKENIDIWELEIWEGSIRFDISYWENRWDGYAQINRNIVFEGFTYNLSDILDSSFRMKVTDISLTANLYRNPQSSFGAVTGFKYMEYYGKLWDITAGVEAKEEAVAPIPYFGLSTEMLVGETTVIGGRFVMFQYAYSGTNVDIANFYQVDAYIEFRASTKSVGIGASGGGLALRIGFHNINIRYENHTVDDRFKITHLMKGTYAAIYLSF